MGFIGVIRFIGFLGFIGLIYIYIYMYTHLLQGVVGLGLARNEEKNVESSIMGYIGTIIRIHSFASS